MRQERRELADMLKTAGVAQADKVIDVVEKVLWDDLREEFIKALTVDSETRDARRRDFNQAIFDAERGYAIWTNTDLGMVLAKYDQAVRRMKGKR